MENFERKNFKDLESIENLCQLISERFCTPKIALPMNLGLKIYNPKNGINSLIVGICWDTALKDWKYLVVDEAWATPPLWVSNKQLFQEMI